MRRFLLLALATSAMAYDDFNVKGEVLSWWMKNSPNPTTFVAESLLDPESSLNGLNFPESVNVVGDESVGFGSHVGGRFTLFGMVSEDFGVQGSYLFLPNQSHSESVSSDGSFDSNFYIIPYYDVTENEVAFAQLSSPGETAGEATLEISNGMQSAEALLAGRAYRSQSWDAMILTGFKWWYFREHLTFNTSSPSLDPPPSVFETEDSFKAKNNFYGGLVGLCSRWHSDWFVVEMIGKVSMGYMQTNLAIAGSLFTDEFGAQVAQYSGGYFALPTNIGNFTEHGFSVLPEVDINLGLNLTDWMRIEFNGSFLYATHVLWAGNTVDENLNPTQSVAIEETVPTTLVGPVAPTAKFNYEDFWVAGLSVGMSFYF